MGLFSNFEKDYNMVDQVLRTFVVLGLQELFNRKNLDYDLALSAAVYCVKKELKELHTYDSNNLKLVNEHQDEFDSLYNSASQIIDNYHEQFNDLILINCYRYIHYRPTVDNPELYLQKFIVENKYAIKNIPRDDDIKIIIKKWKRFRKSIS